MKSITEMTEEELLQYCTNLRLKGSSYREIGNTLEQSNADSETRKYIIKRLDSLDKKQRIFGSKKERTKSLGIAIKHLAIGLASVIFGYVLYNATSGSGVVFIFNFVLWGFGALMILKGIIRLINPNNF